MVQTRTGFFYGQWHIKAFFADSFKQTQPIESATSHFFLNDQKETKNRFARAIILTHVLIVSLGAPA